MNFGAFQTYILIFTSGNDIGLIRIGKILILDLKIRHVEVPYRNIVYKYFNPKGITEIKADSLESNGFQQTYI